MKGKEKFDEILEQIKIVNTDGAKFYNEGNKAAGTRLKKALMNISKLNKAWRKELFEKRPMVD
jgi:hypothetical protein